MPNLPNGDNPLPNIELRIVRGVARHRSRMIQTPVFLIGSASDCDLVLGDLQFPEVHTYLFVTDRGVSLRHLGDGPEVTVQGEPVRKASLRDGDRIRTGSYEFCLRIFDLPTKPDRRIRFDRSHEASMPIVTRESTGASEVRALLQAVRQSTVQTKRLQIYIENDRDSQSPADDLALLKKRA